MNRSGKTTRKVDQAVQYFFKNGVAYIYEGRERKESHHEHAFSIFKKRMEAEHPSAQYTYKYGCYDGVWCYKVESHNL
jgi:hypothetical protein